MPYELNLDQRRTRDENKPADECLPITSIQGIFQGMVAPQGLTEQATSSGMLSNEHGICVPSCPLSLPFSPDLAVLRWHLPVWSQHISFHRAFLLGNPGQTRGGCLIFSFFS